MARSAPMLKRDLPMRNALMASPGAAERAAKGLQLVASMYDFCFVYPYAALLALGGAMGFLTKGSLPSLLGGSGSAAVLAACAAFSHRAYEQGRLCRPATSVALLVASALTVVMGLRWQRTQKVMPAGLVSVLSAAMAAFLAWHLLVKPSPSHLRKR